VEVNFLIKKSKIKPKKPKKKVTIKEESSSSSFSVKLDTLIKTMERMMDRITIDDRQVKPSKGI